MKKKRVALIIISAVIIAVVCIGVKLCLDLQAYKQQVDEITITDVDLSKIVDGTYNGSYETLMVSAEVNVTVENGKITRIDLVKHDHGKGASAEIVTDKVKEAQSLDVDIVSGATSSSKVILKAIENALSNAVSKP